MRQPGAGDFMIVDRNGRYVAKPGHDHESALRQSRAGLSAGAYVTTETWARALRRSLYEAGASPGVARARRAWPVAWTGPSANALQEVLDRYLGESADAMA